MASNTYQEDFPDYTDPKNKTGTSPGFRLDVVENDGIVGLSLQPIGKNAISGEDSYHALLSVQQAKQLIKGIEDAIRRAES